MDIMKVFDLALILIIILSIVFRKGNKRLLWILVLIFLVAFSAMLLTIGSVFIYSLPKAEAVVGIRFLYLPVINGIVILLLSFPLIFLCRKNKLSPTEQPSSKRWLWFSSAEATLFIAFFVFIISVYYPKVIGADAPNPNVGVFVNLVLTVVGSFLLYYSSKFNTPTQPNLLRWLAFLNIVFFSFIAFSFMLILIYAMPPHNRIIYPFLASILSFNIIFLSLVAVGIAKDYVPKVKDMSS
jgi:hypothetical protein